ncbi:MAG: hypothetical protein BZY88_00755 [SAR202 cluster bacterium Io17-Chloro-G9]|nr:MAG: hypothetical protein BZY88_00755 [SAR202 cluster bacterium Io17-Chloro-G9]
MLKQVLDDCSQVFAEVVIMISNSATSAEVYTMFDDLRYTDDGETVTFMAEGGTHMHLNMDQVKAARLIQTTNAQGLPSYSLWLIDADKEPVLRVYLRKSEQEETNQPRHEHFLGLIEKYGESFAIPGDNG